MFTSSIWEVLVNQELEPKGKRMNTESYDKGPELEDLVIIICKLRLEWFKHVLMHTSNDRVWEDDYTECMRLKSNADILEKFNAQTEAILKGCQDIPIAPTSCDQL